MRKFIIYLLAITLLSGGFALPAYGAEAVLKTDVEIEITDVETGNICKNDKASFMITLKNPERGNRNFNIDYEITGSKGNVVESKVQNISVSAKTVQFYPCSVSLPGYDVYQVDISVTSGADISVNKSTKVAYVKKNKNVNSEIGMTTQITNGYDDDAKTIPQMETAGFGIVRDSIRWDRADNGDGTYTVPKADMEWIDHANEAGMKVIMLAWQGNKTYNEGSMPTSEEDLREVTSYSAQIAEQLNGKVWAYEVWNEPNNWWISESYKETTGAEYAALLKAVHEGIRSVDKKTPIIGGSLTPVWEAKQDTVQYFRDMMAAGAGNYMDIFSFHPYSYEDGGVYYDEGDPADDLTTQITYVQNILDEYNFDGEIYITEIGASTHESRWGVTEWEQAVSLSRIATIAETDKRVGATAYYTWLEKSTVSTEEKWGIVSYKYDHAKPAYAALSFRNSLLGGIENREKMEQGVYEYALWNGGRIYTLWSTKGNSEVFNILRGGNSVSYGSNKITCPNDYIIKAYDMYGNIINGEYITATEAPVYVSCMPKSTAEISVVDNIVTVKGSVSDKEKPITILAQEAGGGKIVCVDQLYANAYGEYKTEFSIDPMVITSIFVYDGEDKNKQGISGIGMLDIRFYSGDKEIMSPNEITDGDVCVKIKTSSSKELVAFAAVVGANNVLTAVDSANVNSTHEASLDVTMEKGAEFKFMLWDSALRPVLKPITSK